MSAPWGRSKLAAPKRCSTHRFVRISHRVIECVECGLRRIKDHEPGEKLTVAKSSSRDYVIPVNYTKEEKRALRSLGGLPSGEMPRRR